MRVINFNTNMVMILDTEDDRLPHGTEDTFTPQEFKDYFGIDFSNYTAVTYEKHRGMFIVEKLGEQWPEGFENPEDEPVLAQIAEKESEIIDYVVLRHLRRELPSPYHKIVNYKYVLPDEYKAEYEKLVEEKAAYTFLMETMAHALREIEETLNPRVSSKSVETLAEDPVMIQRTEMYSKISDDFWLRKNGLKRSIASDKMASLKKTGDKLENIVSECSPEEIKKLMEK